MMFFRLDWLDGTLRAHGPGGFARGHFGYQNALPRLCSASAGSWRNTWGTAFLSIFGYPLAHEDDAEWTVWAGLELVAAVSALKAPTPLQTHVGTATGMVVVGDLIGSGEAQERGIVGKTPNLAARLQSIAEPNTVVIADGTRKLLGNLFELEDLGAKELKGIAGQHRLGRRCGRRRQKAASRRCTQLV